MRKVLSKQFFEYPAPHVATKLLGMYIVRKMNGTEIAFRITETEAYEGLDDLASHASKGRTLRTEVMFGEAGVFYIYLIYGLHFMLNVVTGKKGFPSAVLIRSTDAVEGPGRLTRKLSITKNLNGCKVTPNTSLWFEDRGDVVAKQNIIQTPRIGVEYSGEIWAKKPWRFVLRK